MRGIWRAFEQFPFLIRAWLGGGVIFGIVGGVAGLVLGLNAYPPTAWFAVMEVGAPAGFVGACLGLVTGLLIKLIRWVNPHLRRDEQGKRQVR